MLYIKIGVRHINVSLRKAKVALIYPIVALKSKHVAV